MDLFSLVGKTALISGGSRGLGLGMAKGLARAGADVVLLARSEDQLKGGVAEIRALGREAWYVVFDLANTRGIAGALGQVVEKAGDVDILVNCAGIQLRGPAEEVSLDDWQAVLDVNVTSFFAASQAFAKHCIARGKPGRVINIGSLGCEAARPTTAPYSAAKGGVKLLTKALAVDWAKHNINVNAIGPGYFQTEMTEPLYTDPEFDEWVRSKTPLDRWGTPEDLVGAAVFLASGASSFVTGQTIYVDGGWLANL